MQKVREQVISWLDTFSPIKEMTDKPEAIAKEISTISGVFERDGATLEQIEKAFQHIKMTNHSRAWPTAAQCFDALREIKRENTGERITSDKGGDRYTLSGKELSILESQTIPTAKRWLRLFPNLRSHALSTLQYWHEPLVDDMGKKYDNSKAKAN
jgi:hypothetical protein